MFLANGLKPKLHSYMIDIRPTCTIKANMFWLSRPVFSELPCLFSTFHLEYTSVLSRFCLTQFQFLLNIFFHIYHVNYIEWRSCLILFALVYGSFGTLKSAKLTEKSKLILHYVSSRIRTRNFSLRRLGPSPIHSTSLEIGEVSSDAAILLIRVPQQNDTAIVMSAL